MSKNGTVDYSKGLIYKLCCKDPTIKDIYIGSTTNMRNRKNKHKSNCNNPNSKEYNYKVYQTIREFGGWDNWDMILVEYVNTTSKKELEKEERVVIELLKPTLNYNLPTRTQKEYYEDNKEKILEYNKKYSEENKKKISEYNKKYSEENKEKIKEQKKVKVKCEFCECLIRKDNIKIHQKTIKCKKFQIIED